MNATRTFDRYPPALRIQCPRCNAGPAQPCQSKRGQRSATIHALRTAMAEGRIGYRCSCTRIWPTYATAERCADTHHGGRIQIVRLRDGLEDDPA